tara:strand:- start:820 stop:2031 length:1212 start_codon:yes stop_codon:yes gene_type:complete
MLAVLKSITPDKGETKAILSTAKNFVKKLNSKLKEGKAVLGGSIAKGTWLSGDYDIDIFAMFNKEYIDKDISGILEKKLKSLKPIKISGIRKVKGSRDYFQIRQDPYTFEVVPIIKISRADKAENITDISPLHTKWLKKKTNKKLLNEIRLTKAFCKSNKLYGAESYIKGFSGYSLEILTVYYGGFEKLMKAASKWKNGLKIDIEKHYQGLNQSKVSPLIIIDPVQHDRNTSAALSENKFNLFIDIAKKFNRNPSPRFFERKKLDLEDLKGAVVLAVAPLSGKEDVVGSKLLKAFEFIGKRLKEEGFKIGDYDWEWNKTAIFWYFVKNKKLSINYKHFGPPIKEDDHLEKFRKKYSKNPLKKQGSRVYVELTRDKPYVMDYLKVLIKHSYLKGKVKGIKILKD